MMTDKILDIKGALSSVTAKIEIALFHSSDATTKSVCDKYTSITQLTLQQWPDFEKETLKTTRAIPNCILKEPITACKPRQCTCEADVSAMADVLLFNSLEQVMKTLACHKDYAYVSAGDFLSPFGRTKVLGDPDRVWGPSDTKMGRLTVEFKSPWAMNSLDQFITKYTEEYKGYRAGAKKEKVTRAVEQVFVYMSINHHRYAALTTLDETIFFKRVGSPDEPHKSVLQLSPVITCVQKAPYTLKEAWIAVLLTVERDSEWLYISPNSSEVASPSIDANLRWKSNERIYQPKDLMKLFKWKTIIARSQAGAVALGTYKNIDNVIFKTIDLSKHPGGVEQFRKEMGIYKALESLQGNGPITQVQ
jgi:hypothetical protein